MSERAPRCCSSKRAPSHRQRCRRRRRRRLRWETGPSARWPCKRCRAAPAARPSPSSAPDSQLGAAPGPRRPRPALQQRPAVTTLVVALRPHRRLRLRRRPGRAGPATRRPGSRWCGASPRGCACCPSAPPQPPTSRCSPLPPWPPRCRRRWRQPLRFEAAGASTAGCAATPAASAPSPSPLRRRQRQRGRRPKAQAGRKSAARRPEEEWTAAAASGRAEARASKAGAGTLPNLDSPSASVLGRSGSPSEAGRARRDRARDLATPALSRGPSRTHCSQSSAAPPVQRPPLHRFRRRRPSTSARAAAKPKSRPPSEGPSSAARRARAPTESGLSRSSKAKAANRPCRK
mmetsp:Transcript_127790/g.409216  ORF Transcript_127790/g.409216 Transcript_127790/m.409216 type:complete len:347 (+) Transcript_127790:154-1194(+)